MNLFKNLLIVGGIFIFLTINVFAQGREVTIFLKDGTKKTGELLVVRDSVIAIMTNKVAKMHEIVDHPKLVKFAFVKEINKVLLHKVEVEGAINGAWLGAGAGGIVSAIDFLSSDYESNSIQSQNEDISSLFTNIFGGAAIGFVAGWAVATIQSEDEEVIRPTSIDALIEIKGSARFNKGEPDFIKKFINELLQSRR